MLKTSVQSAHSVVSNFTHSSRRTVFSNRVLKSCTCKQLTPHHQITTSVITATFQVNLG